jgi:para-aminobenzoate synthetase component 1
MNRLGSKGIPFLFIIDFDMAKPVILPLSDVDPDSIGYNFNGHTNITDPAGPLPALSFTAFPIQFTEYEKKFTAVVRHLEDGDSYLVNLTQPTKIETNATLNELFHRGRAKYRLRFHDEFVFFSPESFVSINDGTIATYPMKGTIRVDSPDAEQRLLADDKESAEHLTVVDLLRNDIGIVATGIAVEKYRYIDRIITHRHELLQMSSKITGRLEARWQETVGDLLCSLLPAGSITGAPKVKTVEIIREVEGYERGYYTGVAGIFTGASLDSCVMIRFIEKTAGGMVFKSGGGITVYSNARSEYNEMLEKVYVPTA